MQSVQLRLGFEQPSRPVTVTLGLSGLTVLVTTSDGSSTGEAWTYLSHAGMEPLQNSRGELTFPAARLAGLVNLPPQVEVRADPDIAPLVELVTCPPHGGVPAELFVDPDGSMWMTWQDGRTTRTLGLPRAAAGALVISEVAFVATPEGMEALRTACPIPLMVGRCRYNRDGFIEITTAKPQMTESSDIPGLFRLDETHFGVPLPYAESLRDRAGFLWEGYLPLLARGPRTLPDLPLPLSEHAASDLRDLVDALAAYGSQAVVWDQGLGRRVMALAALESLDAWPAMVLCEPATLWVWRRHAQLFGKSVALAHGEQDSDADLLLVTYEQFAARPAMRSPQAVIFDDMTGPSARSVQVAGALATLGGLVDAYRIGLARSWPRKVEAVNDAMAMLRPGEFQVGAAVAERYPSTATARFWQHVQAYVRSRSDSDPGRDRRPFPRSSAMTLEVPQALRDELRKVPRRHPTGQMRLLEELEMVSAGSAMVTSPKIAQATALATYAAQQGFTVAVVTRSRRTEALLTSLLRPLLGTQPGQGGVDVIWFDRELPDLSRFGHVVVVDYPWSFATLDTAVGPVGDIHGPMQVTCLHLAGTVDDRVAVRAAARAQMGPVVDHTMPPSDAEVAHLLG